jgi:ATP-dependent helicase/nuclease subunit B
MASIYFGKTSDDCFDGMLAHLKLNLDKKEHYVFVVPDRMTVIAEKKIFEKLSIESTCNIEVLTLSRLFSRLVPSKTIISKTASCMILQKILRQEKNKLLCFNRNIDEDLAEVIFGTISQFKSCKVNFDEVAVKNGDKLLENKLSDIAHIFKLYENFLHSHGLFDSLDKLNFLETAVASSPFIKGSQFYFCGFDGLTLQGFQIVSNILKSAKSFAFALQSGGNAPNAHIFNENFSSKILNMFNDKNFDTVFCTEKQNEWQNFLADNLFCFKSSCKKVKECNVGLFEGKDFREEVLFVATKIKDMVASKKYSYADFFVAVPNLNDKSIVISEVLSNFGFNFYVDTQEEFKNSVVFRFVENALEMFMRQGSFDSVLLFLKNPLLNLPQSSLDDFEDYALKYNLQELFELKSSNINSCEFFENFNSIRTFLLQKTEETAKSFAKSKTFGDYVLTLQKFFENIELEEKINAESKKFYAENNLKQAKIFEQLWGTLSNVLTELSGVLGDEECDFKTFSSTLLSGMSVPKISTTPLSIDSIVVGDASTSFFETRKVLFVIDASESEFPKTFVDSGVISDSDIKAMSEHYKLEPTIFELNKKEQFKAYELLLKPTEKLFLSYNFLSGEKSKILAEIQQMFLIESAGKFAPLNFQNFSNLAFVTRNNNFSVARSNLTADIRALCDGVRDKGDTDDSLFQALKDNLDNHFLDNFGFKNQVNLTQNLFFQNSKTSVSQIENFMTCPFFHFVTRGLKLKEKDEGKLERNFIGLILHEVARDTLKTLKMPQDESAVAKTTREVFKNIIQKDDYSSLVSCVSNAPLIKNLENEAVKFMLALNEQSKHSRFEPKFFEERFSDSGRIKSPKIDCNGVPLSLVGQVDRLDESGEYFRIIDYKTGEVDTSLKELFFGKKIQLETYLKVCEDSLKLKPAGAYYLPVKGGFGDEKSTIQKKYQLKGNTLDSFKVACLTDDRLNGDAMDSDIVQLKFKASKSGQKEPSGYSKIVSQTDFENFGNYAYSLIQKACCDIQTLRVTPCPLVIGGADACENCPYSALCRFDKTFGNFKRKVKAKVTKDTFKNCNESKKTLDGTADEKVKLCQDENLKEKK